MVASICVVAIIILVTFGTAYRRRKNWRDEMQSTLAYAAQQQVQFKNECRKCRNILMSSTHTLNESQMAQLNLIDSELDRLMAESLQINDQVEQLRNFLETLEID